MAGQDPTQETPEGHEVGTEVRCLQKLTRHLVRYDAGTVQVLQQLFDRRLGIFTEQALATHKPDYLIVSHSRWPERKTSPSLSTVSTTCPWDG